MSTGPVRLVVATTVPVTAHALLHGQLRWLAGHGIDVHLVSSPGPLLDRTGEREGVGTHAIPMARELSPLADLVALGRWLRLLRRLRPQVVSYGTPKAGLLAGVAAAVLKVPRRVYVLRGLRYEGTRGVRRRLLRAIERLTCATAHVVVAVSPSLAATAVGAGVVRAGKVTVVGAGSSNGVDPVRFRPARPAERAAARAAAGIPADAPVVTFVGRLVPDKGLVCLDAAFARLRERLPDARLLLVGQPDDPADPALRRLRDRPGVHALGFLDEPVQRYAAADVLCLPTRREGFPNVVLEAAACRIPAVTTRATGAVDSVVDGQTGFVVPVDDPGALAEALERLCADPPLRARLGGNARRRALRDFPPERIWRGLLGAYGVSGGPVPGQGPAPDRAALGRAGAVPR
ncbi:glycosyltransferase [Micromonospora auratinigra]|uniref:Glycosyltransferase involved in cell wall bisynthesis n=1 Tax=Micromonospora auratinigra TaxID=261654 RepID=A0A1A8Z1N3_9ACTN|nr:glycosyltransferase [Micromonospora auratinigra]SBT37739.1 Glycosyltransferase involved in cell wall bisynthesis [Micromonospora auratinigra]